MIDREGFLAVADRILATVIAKAPERPKEFAVRMSSGTTGRPIVTLARHGTIEWMGPLVSQKCREGKNIFLGFGSVSIRMSQVLHIRYCTDDTVLHVFAIDAEDVSEAPPEFLNEFSPDTVVGTVTFVEYVTRTFTSDAVRRLILGGERLVPAVANLLAGRFPQGKVFMHYIAGEVGGVGANTCGALPLNHYHPYSQAHVEIVDCDEAGTGDIVVSKVLYKDIAVRRYRLGDVGRFLKKQCVCGDQRTFEHLGRRGYDYIKLAGLMFVVAEFDRVVCLRPDLFGDYRAEILYEDAKHLRGKIRLRVFLGHRKDNLVLRNHITHHMETNLFLTKQKTLGDMIRAGMMAPLELIVTTKPFPQDSKSLKLRQLF